MQCMKNGVVFGVHLLNKEFKFKQKILRDFVDFSSFW